MSDDPKDFLKRHPGLLWPSPDQVEYTITPEDEYDNFRGHFDMDNPAETRRIHRWIQRQLANGNPWAWCSVKVTAKWHDEETGTTYEGDDYLGCCSYKSEKDFVKGGYLPQMKEEAYKYLIAQMKRSRQVKESVDPKQFVQQHTNGYVLALNDPAWVETEVYWMADPGMWVDDIAKATRYTADEADALKLDMGTEKSGGKLTFRAVLESQLLLDGEEHPKDFLKRNPSLVFVLRYRNPGEHGLRVAGVYHYEQMASDEMQKLASEGRIALYFRCIELDSEALEFLMTHGWNEPANLPPLPVEEGAVDPKQLLQEQIYKLSTTQIDLPDEIGQHVIQWGELNIPDDSLYVDEKNGPGRETEQHVTVLYGLTDQEPPDTLKEIVGNTKPFLIELGGTSVFENEKYDVLKLDVISEELQNLHMQLKKACPNDYKWPDYKPHVTIAYLKKGEGQKLAQQDVFKAAKVPRDFWAYELLFKGSGDSEDGKRPVELLSFDRTGDDHEEPKAEERRYALANENIDPKQFVQQRKPKFWVLKASLRGGRPDWYATVGTDSYAWRPGENGMRNAVDFTTVEEAEEVLADERKKYPYAKISLFPCYDLNWWNQPNANDPVTESDALAESEVDPKAFAMDIKPTGYLIRTGSMEAPGQWYWYTGLDGVFVPKEKATVYAQKDEAEKAVQFILKEYGLRPHDIFVEHVYSELKESDVDPKAMLSGANDYAVRAVCKSDGKVFYFDKDRQMSTVPSERNKLTVGLATYICNYLKAAGIYASVEMIPWKWANGEGLQESLDPKERKWAGQTKQSDELAKTDPQAATVMAAGGTLIRPPLPSREKWNAMLAAYAPGCGSPTPYPGTGSQVPCGSTVEGKLFLCPHCEPLRESEVDPKAFVKSGKYVIRRGAGPSTKYFYGSNANFTWVPDYERATAYSHDVAVQMLEWLKPLFSPSEYMLLEPANIEESEVDPKQFLSDLSYVVVRDDGYGLRFIDATDATGFTPIRAKAKLYTRKEAVEWADALNSYDNPSEERLAAGEAEGRFVGKPAKPVKYWIEIARPKRLSKKKMIESSGPFSDEDGLPGEVTSFLRSVRSLRSKKAARPII
jgi:2'-5' RNA ligase